MLARIRIFPRGRRFCPIPESDERIPKLCSAAAGASRSAEQTSSAAEHRANGGDPLAE